MNKTLVAIVFGASILIGGCGNESRYVPPSRDYDASQENRTIPVIKFDNYTQSLRVDEEEDPGCNQPNNN